MRKVILGLVMVLTLGVGMSHAFKRGMEKSNPTFSDKGDSADRAAVVVGTTTPVAILSTQTYASGVREFKVCNPNSFLLFIGTFSAVSGSTTTATNAREVVIPNTCSDTMWNNPLWAIFESASGGVSKLITTIIRYQSGE